MTTEEKVKKSKHMSIRKRGGAFSVLLDLLGNSSVFPGLLLVIQKAEDYSRMQPHPPTALGKSHRALLAPEAGGGVGV